MCVSVCVLLKASTVYMKLSLNNLLINSTAFQSLYIIFVINDFDGYRTVGCKYLLKKTNLK